MNQPEISVSLRVVGDALNVSEVTRLLGCPPTRSMQKGDELKTDHFVRTAPTGVWSLKSDCLSGDINSAVNELLGKLNPDLDAWETLGSRFRIDLFCGVFLQSANQGFALYPATLKDLAIRGIALSFDIYGKSRT